MEVEFRNRELIKLYETGKSRKYRLNKHALKKFFMRVQELEAAADIYDLWHKPSLKFEKLAGRKRRYSIRVDRNHRLEFEMQWQSRKRTKGTVIIKEVSKHYER